MEASTLRGPCAPASAVSDTAPTPVIEHVAPVPAVTYATQETVIEYVAPAPADTHAAHPVIDYVTPSPMMEYIAPAPSVTCAAPGQLLPPAYTMTAVATGVNLDTTGLVNPRCSSPVFEFAAAV